MAEELSDNKRIAKNTLMLYGRMLFTLVVSLFTARIVLDTLGVEDYGIYNVVGGVVSMFSLISGSISASIGRFLTFELGTGNMEKLKRVFTTAVNVQIILAIIIIIAAEIIGIWFLNNELKIADGRMYAAHWVFHCSVFTFALNLIMMPYGASIMSHEHMSVYAYMTILDTILKLVIIYALYISPFDKLISYALLYVAVTILVQFIYWSYCHKHFEECRYKPTLDKKLFRQMFGFAGWEMIGSSAAILRGQGNNILINIFSGGTAVNAAAGIATTITGIVGSFTSNFMTAFNPQITKKYAAQKYQELILLLHRGSKFSAYLLLFFAIPTMINVEYVLYLWLGHVPEYTVNFVRLILIFSLTETMARPLITAKLATGVIRNYQIAVGGVLLLTLPLSYLSLKLGAPVEAVYLANITTSILAFFVRLYMLRGDLNGFSSRRFIFDVYLRVILVSILAAIPPIITYILIEHEFVRLLTSCSVSVVSSIIVILYAGCTQSEREFIIGKVKGYWRKLTSKFRRK